MGYFWSWLWKSNNIFHHQRNGKFYRKQPVPFTGKRVYGSYYRYPKTKQENVENHYFDIDSERKEYKIKIRKRRVKLPTSWDDKARSDWRDRSWKRYRKHQWKE